MARYALIALAAFGIALLSGCGETIKCTSCNAGNDYKCCPTGRFDADGECDD